ncbi:MAG: hypothetical protein JWO35_495 [Candidatus Saccharibacteria bacterium]|nr:hypothetical protein [Candidatus Saccharibacteria bacterium]
MANFIFACILLLLAIAGVVVRKTYYYVPVLELKRRAEHQDAVAAQLYRAVAYGNSLRVLLWVFIALTSAGGFVLLSRQAPVWLSFVAVIALLWAAFSWLPASKVTKTGTKLTSFVTPIIAWLLNYLHPLLSRSGDIIEKRYSATAHTGIFEREDLLALIDRQQHQEGSRLSQEELEIAKRALSFDDYKVGDILTPRKHIKTVLAEDTLGPILIDELHKGGHPYVLVRESPKGAFVGSLDFAHLDHHRSGKVKDFMNPTVYYVHENDRLSEALHAFFVTNHALFIVVNSFEEYVGIITVESMLRQLLGHVPGDDFDEYANLSAVAARHHQAKKPKKSAETPVKTDEEVVK